MCKIRKKWIGNLILITFLAISGIGIGNGVCEAEEDPVVATSSQDFAAAATNIEDIVINNELAATAEESDTDTVLKYSTNSVSATDALRCPPPYSNYVNGLLGSYYDSFNPVSNNYLRMKRIDASPASNYLFVSPDPSIEPDTFSIVWNGFIDVPASGEYVFSALTDDGVELTIDGQTVIHDEFNKLINLKLCHGDPITLEAGKKYAFEMKYQEGPLHSHVHLIYKLNGNYLGLVSPERFWITSDVNDQYAYLNRRTKYYNRTYAQGDGLSGKYFDKPEAATSTFSVPVAYRTDPDLCFDWSNGSPAPRIPVDNYSARWSGYIEAKYSENAVLDFTVDDGLYVIIRTESGIECIDAWTANNVKTYSLDLNMKIGHFYPMIIYYNELSGSSSIAMSWRSKYNDAHEKEIVPAQYLYSCHPSF